MMEEYYYYSVKQAQEERRNQAWKTKECQAIYHKLLDYVGKELVRPGMRGRAKQIAITAYLKDIEPDYETFAKNEKRKGGKK